MNPQGARRAPLSLSPCGAQRPAPKELASPESHHGSSGGHTGRGTHVATLTNSWGQLLILAFPMMAQPWQHPGGPS